MGTCIFCGAPCRGNICEDCFEEIAEMAPKAVITRLVHSVASREKPAHKNKEDDSEEE